jgi:RNA recognition motif-containing protein
LPLSVTESQLSSKFFEHGDVVSVRVITDHRTGRSLGYGFVEMATRADADRVMKELDGQAYDGRQLTVRAAIPNR